MNVIEIRTQIAAPIETCFELSLNIDLELEAAQGYGLRAVSGVTSGSIGPGEQVEWRTKQFGITVAHVSQITAYEPPVFFQDKMVSGLFRSFEHNHFFQSLGSRQTEMRDRMSFSMPLWLLGGLSERLLVRQRLIELLSQRNELLKQRAEKITS